MGEWFSKEHPAFSGFSHRWASLAYSKPDGQSLHSAPSTVQIQKHAQLCGSGKVVSIELGLHSTASQSCSPIRLEDG